MIFLTSISPKHILENRQQYAVKTWLKHGRVLSFNHPSEIELIKSQGYEGVEFVKTWRTQMPMFGKHYVTLNALTDYIKEHELEEACIINSDISITENKDVIDRIIGEVKSGSFVYLHRWDHNGDEKSADEYRQGVDAFFMNHEMADTLPQTSYCLGHCFFDIWLPYHFIINEVPTKTLKQPVIYHQRHNAQYKPEHWHIMGNHTGFWMGRTGKPHEISTSIYNTLTRNTIWI